MTTDYVCNTIPMTDVIKGLAMPNTPAISRAEWEVMKVLWEQPGIAASQVVEHLAGRTDWSPRTVKTLLNRLIRKGALSFQKEGKRYLYRPRVRREACARRESRSLLHRVFSGRAAPLLIEMISRAELSDEEIAQLRRLLDEKGAKP